MITVNTYLITERAVWQGVTSGAQRVLSSPDALKKPETIIEAIAESVMNELSEVLDFGVQPIRFTKQMEAALWQLSQQQQAQEQETQDTQKS